MPNTLPMRRRDRRKEKEGESTVKKKHREGLGHRRNLRGMINGDMQGNKMLRERGKLLRGRDK